MPVEGDRGLVPIYFNVKLKLDVTVERVFGSIFDRKIGIYGIEYVSSEPTSKAQITEEGIEGEFPVYASIEMENRLPSSLLLRSRYRQLIPISPVLREFISLKRRSNRFTRH